MRHREIKRHWLSIASFLFWLYCIAPIGCNPAVPSTTEKTQSNEAGSQIENNSTERMVEKREEHATKDSMKDASSSDRRAESAPEKQTESRSDTKIKEESPKEESQKEQLSKGKIQIYLKGDTGKVNYSDSFSGQTATQFKIALSRYEIMKNANDPNPQLCFDHGKKQKIADLSRDNLMGECITANLKTGLYTHGRVKVDWIQYTVKGTFHISQQVLPGRFTYFRAYSNTNYKNKTYSANQGWVQFDGAVTRKTPMTYPIPIAPAGLRYQIKNGDFYMIFPYKKALPIDRTSQKDHWARFHWKIFKAFRWEEKSLPNYQKGVWDSAFPIINTEVVKMFGVSDFYITTSID